MGLISYLKSLLNKDANSNIIEEEKVSINLDGLNDKSSSINTPTATNAKVNFRVEVSAPNFSNSNPNDDYTNTIFLTMFQYNGKELSLDINDYPRWLQYELNIGNPVDKFKEMIEKDFLEKENYESALSYLKVPELKKILSDHQITAKGKKADLIEAVAQNIKAELISNNLTYRYVLSDKGKKILKENKDYIEIRNLKKYQITKDEFYRMKTKFPDHLKIRDIAWEILNERYNYNYINKKYGLARCEFLYCAYFLEDEQKYQESLKYYIRVLYYDVSGDDNGLIEKLEDLDLAPGIIDKLRQHKKHYTDEMVDDCFQKIYLPNLYLNKEQFKNLLEKIFNNKFSLKLIENL